MSSKKTPIFRQAALDRISSPEQLDALLPVTSSTGWLALLTFAALITLAFLWSIFGSLPRSAMGQGIIVRDGEAAVLNVATPVAGEVEDIPVHVGEIIRVDDVVAHLHQEMLDTQEDSAAKSLAALKRQDEQQQKSEQEQLTLLRDRLASQTDLLAKGLLTRMSVLQTKNTIYELESRVHERQRRLEDMELRLNEMQINLTRHQTIRAIHEGRVVEIVVEPGDHVNVGTRLMTLEKIHGEYEAVVYVPAADGKRIHVDMEARISPSTVKPEEFGYIEGKVTAVSAFPVSNETLAKRLRNDRLASQLTQGSSPIEIHVRLKANPNTPSGFQWTSSRGPDTQIFTGTVCSGRIIYDRERPIETILPYLRRKTGLYE